MRHRTEKKTQGARGFTLIEVMVALAIFVALALAINSTMSANVHGISRFEEKTLAAWVASNKLVELQVYQQWPENGRQDDASEFAGREWFIETEVAAGPLPDTRRVDISVGLQPEGTMAEKYPVSTLTALLVKPTQPSEAPPPTPPAGGG
ncbi:MAG: type II secretion system minor pseudopilin GspI [Pseudomonadota bacterium]